MSASWLTVLGIVVNVIAIGVSAGVLWRQRGLRQRIAMLEGDLDAVARGCAHDEVRNVGTFGAPSYQCARCGALV